MRTSLFSILLWDKCNHKNTHAPYARMQTHDRNTPTLRTRSPASRPCTTCVRYASEPHSHTRAHARIQTHDQTHTRRCTRAHSPPRHTPLHHMHTHANATHPLRTTCTHAHANRALCTTCTHAHPTTPLFSASDFFSVCFQRLSVCVFSA